MWGHFRIVFTAEKFGEFRRTLSKAAGAIDLIRWPALS